MQKITFYFCDWDLIVLTGLLLVKTGMLNNCEHSAWWGPNITISNIYLRIVMYRFLVWENTIIYQIKVIGHW